MRRCPPIALAILCLALFTAHAEPPSPQIVSRIKRTPVESSVLATVGYSKRLRALEIEFRNGAIYRYLGVESAVYDALLKAPSKTGYYDQNIRHKYRSLHVRRRLE
jgi:KTSC domain